jgi:hypothetical protein
MAEVICKEDKTLCPKKKSKTKDKGHSLRLFLAELF